MSTIDNIQLVTKAEAGIIVLPDTLSSAMLKGRETSVSIFLLSTD